MEAIAHLKGKFTKEKTDKRYCTVYESLRESFKEMRLIKEGKLETKTWEEFKKELEDEGE